MSKIVAVANQKGGVGKTTTAINLAAELGEMGLKILMVDIDPQGNATSGLGINKREIRGSTYNLLIANEKIEDIRIRTQFKNLDILPSNIDLAGVEIELVEMSERTYRLKQSLAPIKEQYDFIFIDCPPSLGLITLNAFSAANSVLVPIQCEYYALEGLSQLMSTIRQVKRMYNPNIELEGVLLTMFDSRLNLTLQVTEEVKKYFKDDMFKSVIPRNVRLYEAPSFVQPIQYYDHSSKGSEAYGKLAKEFLRNNKEKKGA
ncbi:MAG: AAA family ATPase [Oscillospiraceae bacterium]|jgi:chromosome partitioning protein|nr:AAA family ATPase [Oscillospiraceae bacterium]